VRYSKSLGCVISFRNATNQPIEPCVPADVRFTSPSTLVESEGNCCRRKVEVTLVPPPPVLGHSWNASGPSHTKNTCNRLITEYLLWWRRGELNPRPKSVTHRSLHAYLSSIWFALRAKNEQDTRLASPMVLAQALRTERLRPAHCVTPLTGPMSKARGSVALN
jgi:hypothetical protein